MLRLLQKFQAAKILRLAVSPYCFAFGVMLTTLLIERLGMTIS
jgi:hypothetical protein